MELGVAGTIAIKTITSSHLDAAVNEWLECNPEVEVLQMKPHSISGILSMTIFYRKE